MPGPVRALLPRLEVRRAGRRARCAKNKAHIMEKGDLRFVVQERAIAAGEKGYCPDCALAMIDKARAQLDDLQAQLS